MQYIRPSYYDKFKCIGAACPDTCCRGWQIMIDEDTMQHYQNLEGEFGEAIRTGIDEEESCFLQEKDGKCHFLREDGLCQIFWKSQDEGDWCDTCRTYPRHIEEFEDVREISIGMSCPEAARIIFEETQPLSFIMEEDEEYEEYEDFDYLLYSKLLDIRELLLKILQNRRKSLEERFLTAKGIILEIKNAIDENRFFEIDTILEEADSIKGCRKESRFEERKRLFSYLKEFELLRESWRKLRKQAEGLLYQADEDVYEKAVLSFYEDGYAEGRESWELAMEQIAVYFIFIYLCGAVYDDRVKEKYEMAEFAVKMIEDIAIAYRQIKGDKIDREDLIRIAGSFCRELEHSDENLELLEELLFEA
jgi:lysine-N-methylase